MSFNPAVLINVFLALIALLLYIIGSYRFYRNRSGFFLILGAAIAIDIITALLASFRITPTVDLPGMESVPWNSIAFKIHVILSTIGFVGFIALFLYLLIRKGKGYSSRIRKWQFQILLPIWVLGESIALINALSKIFFQIRIFDLI